MAISTLFLARLIAASSGATPSAGSMMSFTTASERLAIAQLRITVLSAAIRRCRQRST